MASARAYAVCYGPEATRGSDLSMGTGIDAQTRERRGSGRRSMAVMSNDGKQDGP